MSCIHEWNEVRRDYCIDDTYAERGRLLTTDELHSRMNEVRRERNEKSCSQSSLLLYNSRWRNKSRRWPRQLQFVGVLYVYFMEYKDPGSMRLRTWRMEGGEAGVLEFLHHGTQPNNAPITTWLECFCLSNPPQQLLTKLWSILLLTSGYNGYDAGQVSK